MAKVIVIGGTGTIGSAVVAALKEDHDIIPVTRHTEEFRVDMTDEDSIQALFHNLGKFDHLVVAAGRAKWGSMNELSSDAYKVGLHVKLMGQVNFVRYAVDKINDGGSITLTAGTYSRHPEPGISALSMVNGALESFIGAVALELERGIRINIVSPPWVSESVAALGEERSEARPAAEVARVYKKSVEGDMTGEVLEVD